jgi:acetoacetyl-CoA reductase
VSDTLAFGSLDVADEFQVKKFFGTITGKIEGLVYAAGVTAPKTPISKFDVTVFDSVIKTNTTGLLLCLKYCYQQLAAEEVRVVVVNSLASRVSSKYSGVEYTISKSALSGLVKQLAMDFAPDNVLISLIFPSMTATPMLIQNVEQSVREAMAAAIPLNRIAMPLEISKAIAFLLRGDNTYITGCGIDINRGQFLNG